MFFFKIRLPIVQLNSKIIKFKKRERPLYVEVIEVSKTIGFWDFGEFRIFSNLRCSRNFRKHRESKILGISKNHFVIVGNAMHFR